MSTVTTEVDTGTDPLSVKISWTAPSSNNDPIVSYSILILDSDGNESEDTTNCAGATIVTNLYCYLPFTTLRNDYGLGYNDLVVARARASNGIGDG